MDRNPADIQPTAPQPGGGAAQSVGIGGGVKQRLAWLNLFWEALWPALWPSVAVAGLFLALALFDILPNLGFYAHAAALAGFLIVFIGLTWRNLRRLPLPAPGAALRRLETASGLAHRPLSGLRDSLGSNPKDPMAAALWQAHQTRLRALTRSLRVGYPSPGLARRDTGGLRAALGLVLVIAIAIGWPDAGERLARAVTPSFTGGSTLIAPRLDAWVNPPSYTGMAPLYLRKDQNTAETAGGALSIPTGSKLLAQVHGGEGQPALVIDGQRTAFQTVDPINHRLELELTQGSSLAIEQDGKVLQSWQITIVPDRAPDIAFASDPSESERHALRLEYRATDDYGLEKVTASIRRVAEQQPEAAFVGEEAIDLTLPMPALAPKQARAAGYHDLTAHPWAGTPVGVTLTASDAIGQAGRSERRVILLPERPFTHPVARAIIEQRKRLTTEPGERKDIADQLAEIASRPQLYNHDTVVFLALKTAIARLLNPRNGPQIVGDAQALLWDTALHLEDGGVSLAERDLRDIQRRLQEALARDASDEELQRLMDELERAMDRFLEAMQQQMEQMAEQGIQPEQFDPSQMQQIDRQDLQRMMDQMRETMRSGARDKAQQMLSQMQQMMENLRAGMQQQQQQQGNQQMQRQMQQMQELQDLTRRQQQLLDQTFRMQQQMEGQGQQQSQQGQQPGEQGQQGPQQGQQNRQQGQQGRSGDAQGQAQGQGQQQGQMTPQQGAALQEALRRALGDLMRRMGEAGEIPRQLGQAERSMRDSSQALQGNQPGEAIPSENEALDQLRSGAQQMAEQMQQQMMAGRQPGQQGRDQAGQRGQQRSDRDPFGRPLNNDGNFATGDVQVPEEADLQRAREIFDELRRRSGDTSRPDYERDYIDRLLRRF